MVARKTTKTATIDPNSVSITDFCQSQGINEQIFRLELMQYLDNADSTKTCDFSVAQGVAAVLLSQSKTLPSSENLTPQELQPAQETAEPQQNSTSQNIPENSQLAQTQSGQGMEASNKTPSTKGSIVPTALDELIQESEEVIELADLVHTYRNAQIVENARTRDSELILQLRERRIETRNQVFDSLRNLNSRQPIAQELPELPGLADEISGLCNELGKSLNRVA
jgi:hypothetical protein